MTLPLRGISRISFPYGVRYKSGVLHKGVDYSDGKEGHVVQAVLPGVVSHSGYGGWGRAYGNHVVIRSILKGPWYTFFKRTQIWTLYGHMKAVNVGVGDAIKVGDQLGLSGGAAGERYSGSSTGPHLHFQVGTRNDYLSYIDPMPYIKYVAKVSASDFTTDKMKASSYGEGAVSDAVLWLGQRIELHLAALGIASPYRVGPGKIWGPADKAGVKLIQKHLGFRGSDADGYPGVSTLKFLASTPKPKPSTPTTPAPVKKTVTVHVGTRNGAGYNAEHGEATAISRTKAYLVPELIKDDNDIVMLQEWSATGTPDMVSTTRDLLKGKFVIDAIKKGTGLLRKVATTDKVAAGVFELEPRFEGNDKQAAWEIVKIDGAEFLALSLHLTAVKDEAYDSKQKLTGAAARVGQTRSAFKQAIAKAKAHQIPQSRIIVGGDFNSFSAIRAVAEEFGFVDTELKAKTVIGGKLRSFNSWSPTKKDGLKLDHVFVKRDATVEVLEFEVIENIKASDHNRLRIVLRFTV